MAPNSVAAVNQSRSLLVGTFLLVFCAGSANGVMDKLQFHFDNSVFGAMPDSSSRFWNPKQSWKNKYVDWDAGDKQPAFFLSTTALVGLTDAWHLFQSVMITCFVLAILCYRRQAKRWVYVLHFVLLKLSFSAGFTFMFDYLLSV